MAELSASPSALGGPGRRLYARQFQEDALGSLYVATYGLGLALLVLAVRSPQAWRAGFLGLLLQLVPYPARRLLARRYLTCAWLLVVLWMGSALAGISWLPGTAAPCLLALPVGLAALLVSTPAGLLTALGSSLGITALARTGGTTTDAAIAVFVVWGVFVLGWLSLRPTHDAVDWSWEHYDRARRQLDRARDAQADLKQAIKDLADSSVQMARLNQLLGAARRAAEEAERAKAEFVANVSHELRTPLNMVIGFAEMIMQSPKTYGRIPPALRADLAVILRNSQHLSSLIDDVLDLSQIEAGQMALTKERVALREIVDAATEAIRPLFESKGLYLTTEVPGELLAFCDRTRIREVLLNLLSNAGRFTERGGVGVRAWAEGVNVVVAVADTGPGIARQDQEKLFQPFQQIDGSLRRRYGGSGLGLSISRHFVELHGGQMWLESELGRGTTIFFRLPLEPPTPAEDAFMRWLNPEWEFRQRTRRSSVPAPAVRPRVVVVERGQLLQRLLRRYFGQVEIAAVKGLGEAAAELARAPAQALLVNDLSVGQALEEIRQSAILPYGTPALVCALPGEQEAAHALGVDGYLVKPVSRDALLGALDQLQLGRGTVLIVDDEPEAVRLFWRMLTSSGRRYRVLTAENGQRALSILRSERPDVMLLDLVMPAMDGFQLLARRSEEPTWSDVPIIVVSARDPAGHPIVSSALAITRGGGLTVPQLLAHIQSISAQVAGNDPPGRPTRPEGLPG